MAMSKRCIPYTPRSREFKESGFVFPIDRLRELAEEGIIGGVSDKHLGFMLYETAFFQHDSFLILRVSEVLHGKPNQRVQIETGSIF